MDHSVLKALDLEFSLLRTRVKGNGTVSDFTEYQTLVNAGKDFWIYTLVKKNVLADLTRDLEPLLSEVEVSVNDDAKVFV